MFTITSFILPFLYKLDINYFEIVFGMAYYIDELHNRASNIIIFPPFLPKYGDFVIQSRALFCNC